MNLKPVHSRKKGDLNLDIYLDENPPNPREMETLGTMAYAHIRSKMIGYIIGDEELPVECNDEDEDIEFYSLKEIQKESIFVRYYNVKDYGSSGIRIILGNECNSDEFDLDEDAVGVVYILKNDYSIPKVEEMRRIIKKELEEYENYCNGYCLLATLTKEIKNDSDKIRYETIECITGFYDIESAVDSMGAKQWKEV